MTKLTAVEWLINSLPQIDLNDPYYANLFEQAKQMEKEKMENLIKWMYKVSEQEPMRLETDVDDIVQQYYNETYGK